VLRSGTAAMVLSFLFRSPVGGTGRRRQPQRPW